MKKTNRRTKTVDALEARITAPKRLRFLDIGTWGRPRCWPCCIVRRRAVAYPGYGSQRPTPGLPSTLARRSRSSSRASRWRARLRRPSSNCDCTTAPPGSTWSSRITRANTSPWAVTSRSISSSRIATPCFCAWTRRARSTPAERRCRQQEIENLVERYIERSEDVSIGRPVALLLTKFDRVLPSDLAFDRRSLGGARRPIGRRPLWNDEARSVGPRTGSRDLRGQLLRPRCRRQSSTCGTPAHGAGGSACMGGRAARGSRSHGHETASRRWQTPSYRG